MTVEQVLQEAEPPEGWAISTLGDLCSAITDGTHKTPAYAANGIRFLSTANLVPFREGFDFADYERFISIRDHEQLVRRCKPEPGDVLVSKCGTIGRTKEVDVDFPFSIFVGLALLKPLKGLFTSAFLEVFLNSPTMQSQFDELSPGSTRRTLTLAGLKSAQMPLPPLAEQERIVEKVKSLLAKSTSINNRLSHIPSILKRFREGVLAAACSGRLTEEWREHQTSKTLSSDLLHSILTKRPQRVKEHGSTTVKKPIEPTSLQSLEIPDGWSITSIDQLTCVVTSGSRGWAKYYADSGPLFIRAQDINTDRLETDNIAHVQPPKSAEGRRTRVHRGDLLVTITGANVTKTAVVDRELGEAYVSQHVALVRPVDVSIMDFLYLWLVSPLHGRGKLLDDAYGAGKPGLNLDNIRETTVGLPPVEEQVEILGRVKTLFALSDAIEKRLILAAIKAGRLTQSILAKAFRGELVSTEADLARREGREYEPASVLLERIRAENADHSKAPLGPKRKMRRASAPVGA